MPHITLNSDEPGIRGLFRFRPEMAVPLNALADALLCGDNTLTRGERELIATYVSGENDCRFCYSTHAAMAAAWLPEGMKLVDQVRKDLDAAPISAKMKVLVRIAGAVAVSGRKVSGTGRGGAVRGRDGCRDPRHGAHRGGVLHVQPTSAATAISSPAPGPPACSSATSCSRPAPTT